MNVWIYGSMDLRISDMYACMYLCMYVGMYVCMHALLPFFLRIRGQQSATLNPPQYATQLDPGYKTEPSVTPKSRGKRRAKKKTKSFVRRKGPPQSLHGHLCKRTCCFLCVCVCVNVYVHVYVYLILYMYVLRYLYIYICVCVRVCVKSMYIDTYIYRGVCV